MKKLISISLAAIFILANTLSGSGGTIPAPSILGSPTPTPTPTPQTYIPGQLSACKVGGVSFNMRYAPSGSFTSDDNTISEDPNLPGQINVANAYWIAETEVTYQLWKTVYTWATTDASEREHCYTFDNAGREGHDGTIGAVPTGASQEPVTTISWQDAMVWCNALTEFYNAQNGTNLACVYTYKDAIVRDATDAIACDNAMAGSGAKGFRLPTSNEWQLAARYQDGKAWTPGNHVSGDTTSYCCPSDSGTSMVFDNYAWYSMNSGRPTHPVGEKTANTLNIKDMSGNVWEWCFDWYPEFEGSDRVFRGGSWNYDAEELQLGIVKYASPSGAYYFIGFRPVRTQ